ncbi:MAG: type IV pilin, partial [Thermoplasmatota archaeon]
MKANKKYILEEDEAVSAVIGVILMVAITVAIAATVYVYVSGMIGGGQEKTPTVSLTPDNTNSRVRIASADPNIRWNNFKIQASIEVNATHSLHPLVVEDIQTSATDIGGTGN